MKPVNMSAVLMVDGKEYAVAVSSVEVTASGWYDVGWLPPPTSTTHRVTIQGEIVTMTAAETRHVPAEKKKRRRRK
jgi:hypothetical protein